ncbi:MAG: hypothetical protein ACJA0N_000994 [Pseudohongiellaceae bacterium]|jgi:hypothetical protein
MKRYTLAATVGLAMLLVSSAHAAKPTSITFESTTALDDGTAYSVYVVTCSNNTTLKLSAWDKRKKWCIGEGIQEDCVRKQIKAAKKACR